MRQEVIGRRERRTRVTTGKGTPAGTQTRVNAAHKAIAPTTSYEENIIKKSLHWARRSVCDVCILSCSNLFFLSIKIHISEFTKHRRDFLAWACNSVLQHLCVNESEWSTKSSLSSSTLLLQITKTYYYSTRPLLNLELFFCLRVWFNKVKVLLGCTMFSWTERLLMWCMCRR